jgi:Family of unknown function (DUF6411)
MHAFARSRVWRKDMLIAAIIAFCVLVFLVALVWPRISQRLERGGTRPLGTGQRAASKAPGPLGRLLQKPFSKSSRAIHKSGSAGRRAHEKID